MENGYYLSAYCAIDGLLENLPPDKQLRIQRFYRFEDRQRALFGDILSRLLIQKRRGGAFHEINLETDEYGKPYLVNDASVQFNLSHSGKWVACAIGDKSVGIDIEEIRPIDLQVAKHVFAENEERYIRNQTAKQQRLCAFYQIWTMKEAYIKYRGKGLRIPLESFSVLSPSKGAVYQRVFESSEVVCHICMEAMEEINFTYLNVDEFLAMLRDIILLFNSC